MTRVLLVDDDRTLIGVVAAALEEEGYAVIVAVTALLVLLLSVAWVYERFLVARQLQELEDLATRAARRGQAVFRAGEHLVTATRKQPVRLSPQSKMSQPKRGRA